MEGCASAVDMPMGMIAGGDGPSRLGKRKTVTGSADDVTLMGDILGDELPPSVSLGAAACDGELTSTLSWLGELFNEHENVRLLALKPCCGSAADAL